jgi:hypothetical protein
VNPQFDGASRFSHGLAPVVSGKRVGYIDEEGRFVINPQFDDGSWFEEGLAVVKSGSKWGFIDNTGKFVINPQFDQAGNFSEGLASVLIGDRAGFIDREGKLVINPQYDAMSSFSGGLALVVSKGRWAYIDKTGKPVWTMPEPKQAEGSQPGQPMLASGSNPMGDDANRQRQTVADIRNTGTAMFSWLTDQIGSGAAGDTVSLANYPQVTHADLVRVLVPQYMQEVPTRDGWGHLYEYHLNTGNPLAPQVMSIRSPGRDGIFSASLYTVEKFIPSNYDEDIVWADGFFVRWPQKPG